MNQTSRRRCAVCDRTTLHEVEEREHGGVTDLLFTCSQCQATVSMRLHIELEPYWDDRVRLS